MADEVDRRRSFIILEDASYARQDTLNGALEMVRREHQTNPTRRFLVVQVVATVEPKVSTKVTRHI